MDDKERGLYHKFKVERVDGSPKHEGCDYFVLDLDHDPIALYALATYARQARAEGYDLLADDLDGILREKGASGLI